MYTNMDDFAGTAYLSNDYCFEHNAYMLLLDP